MPLLIAPEGQKLKIVKMAVDERAQARLNALGLAEGCSLSVLYSDEENVYCMANGAKLAIERGIAAHIFVA